MTGCTRDNHGFVLPALLFALIIWTLLILAAMRLTDDERLSSRAMRETGAALYVAESGLAATLGSCPAAATALTPGDSLSLGWITLSNRGSYRAVIHRVDNGGNKTYALMIEGKGAGPLGGQSNLTRIVTITSISGVGVVSLGTFGIGGSGGLADSYNSNNGPYNPLVRGNQTTVIANGAVTMNPADTIYGNLITGSTESGGTITGSVQTGVSPVPAPPADYPTLACPNLSPKYNPVGDIGGTYSSYFTSGSKAGELTVGAGKAAILTSPLPSGRPNYYFNALKLTGGSTLTIKYTTTPKQPLVIYVEDNFGAGGGGIVNTSAQPTLLAIKSCGTSSTYNWDMSGGSGMYMTLYAPEHNVVVGGGGDYFGSIVGGVVGFTGGSRMHYDEALGTGVPPLALLAGSWAQLQP